MNSSASRLSSMGRADFPPVSWDPSERILVGLRTSRERGIRVPDVCCVFGVLLFLFLFLFLLMFFYVVQFSRGTRPPKKKGSKGTTGGIWLVNHLPTGAKRTWCC